MATMKPFQLKLFANRNPSQIFVYQDELVTAFRDISPQAKTHILIIPIKSFQRLMT